MSIKVAVIGSQGFIGTRLISGHPDWLGIDLKSGRDFCDLNVQFSADVVVLLAAYLGHNAEDYKKNLEIYTALVSRYAHKDTHIIYTSSAAVYPPSHRIQYEMSRTNPETIYGQSKLLGERIIKDTIKNYTILRLANVFGTGDGKGVIDRFINGHNIIYGTGKQTRDYISVEFVCRAIERITEDLEKFESQTLNISSGVGQTVSEVFEKYGRGQATYDRARDFDVDYSVLANEAAKEFGLL